MQLLCHRSQSYDMSTYPRSSPPPMTQLSEFSTQGTQQDNHVASTGEFNDRLKYWIGACQDHYATQCAICFKAGVAINLSLMTKDPDKFLECATKHKSVTDSLLAQSIIAPSDYHKMKKLKSLNSESPKTTIEMQGWPSGKSMWDRHAKTRLKIRKETGTLMPKHVEDTPSGAGLVQLFQRIGHKLHMDPAHNKEIKNAPAEVLATMDDPCDPVVQMKVNANKQYPFCLLVQN